MNTATARLTSAANCVVRVRIGRGTEPSPQMVEAAIEEIIALNPNLVEADLEAVRKEVSRRNNIA